ncbi:Leucine-rich repeat-containing protein [Artemisia annua]|uniref:Leucine-rich repeat-containing protein n=1 Tax=Artemisia annua TaxID=35608 RepID=A0A2U1N3M5_ARTAN|nr:Leucine-rich repeat-containing protein [Artemisia annua]
MSSSISSVFFLFLIFPTFASSTSSLNNIHKCPEKQSEALLLFKQNLSSINYTNYECQDWLGSDYHPIMMTWNTTSDCCNWDGITCDYSTGDVIGIDVSCGMLKGTINPNSSLFNLPYLQALNLAFNDFHGSQIPCEIRMFSDSLTHLNLSHCAFSGQVPPDITLLHGLVSLDLSFNYFNYITGLKLGPHVFINMFRNFTNLEELSLRFVNISSVLHTSLNISSSLKLLDLFGAQLKGKLPHSIFNIHSLETLDLSYNDFTGDIPSDISVNLTSLSLVGNKLNGTLPSWLFTSPSLEYLNLYDNMFSGNVPFESFSLSSINLLALDHNQLAGQIDVQTFRQLTNLTVLGLSLNNFSGEWELDTLLSSLTNIEYLDLSYSGFSVTTNNANHYVNPSFSELYLVSCKLKVFPNSFRAMRQLERLDISSNEIHGQIPHWAGEIGGDYGLEFLNLSHNFITGLPQFQCYKGEVPHSLSNYRSLRVLDLGNNKLNGTFSVWLGGLSELRVLVLRSNNFHGLIETSTPMELAFSSLQVLDLSHNWFAGKLPGTFFQNFKAMQNMIRNSTKPEYLSTYGNYYSIIVVMRRRWMRVDLHGKWWRWDMDVEQYIVGLVMGYLMLSTRKVKWFNAIVDAAESLVFKKKRRHIYIGK